MTGRLLLILAGSSNQVPGAVPGGTGTGGNRGSRARRCCRSSPSKLSKSRPAARACPQGHVYKRIMPRARLSSPRIGPRPRIRAQPSGMRAVAVFCRRPAAAPVGHQGDDQTPLSRVEHTTRMVLAGFAHQLDSSSIGNKRTHPKDTARAARSSRRGVGHPGRKGEPRFRLPSPVSRSPCPHPARKPSPQHANSDIIPNSPAADAPHAPRLS